MDYFDMINEAIEYIEDNIRKNITLDDLANRYFCSKFHFHRIFQSFVEKPVMQYVKERKMSVSLHQILNSDKKIVDIAFEMGFQSHASFTRLFKTYYGISPEESRKYYIVVQWCDKAKITREKLNLPKPSYLSEPEIVEMDEFEIIGLETSCLYDENIKNDLIPKFWNTFMVRYHEIPNKTEEFCTIGVVWDSDSDNRFNYLGGAKVMNSNEIPKGMKSKKVSKLKYAKFYYIGAMEITKYFKCLDYIFGTWLPDSSYNHNPVFSMLEMGTSETTWREDSKYYIYVPVI